MNPVERQLDLLLLLLSRHAPISAREMFEELPAEAYGGDPAAAERKFSRDKADLKDLGLPIRTETDEDGVTRYTVDRDAFFLPDVPFPDTERAALFAVGAAALKSGFPFGQALRQALAALRASGPSHEDLAIPDDTPALVTSKTPSANVKLLESAFLERRKVRCYYPPEKAARDLRIHALLHRRGRLLVVAYCELRQGMRTFYADRIRQPYLPNRATAAEYEIPADFKASDHLPGPAWTLKKHAPMEVTIRFDAGWEEEGRRLFGADADGKVTVTHLKGLIAHVAALRCGTIVAPAEARRAVLDTFGPLQLRLSGRT